MVCVRCKMIVEQVLQEHRVAYHAVELGHALLEKPLTENQKKTFAKGLEHYQLEIIENRSRILVERIKTEILRLWQAREVLRLKLSAHLSQVLGYNYTYLANTFSEQEGITLEKYFITQRIERAKELIVYEDLSITEVTDELSYSSISHFCLQFKKVTGLTPADFKKRCQSDDFIWRTY